MIIYVDQIPCFEISLYHVHNMFRRNGLSSKVINFFDFLFNFHVVKLFAVTRFGVMGKKMRTSKFTEIYHAE